MKIHELRVDGFGVWKDLRLSDLSGGINVFYGPNEAGKTTLMQFIRTTLYGGPAERRGRYLPPVHGGRAGGSLTLSGPQGPLDVVRHFDRPGTGDVGDLRIVAGDGTLHPDSLLSTVCCGIDEPTFNHVFAVGLREIQELATLDDTDAARQLYTLTTGLDRVSLAEVSRELAASRSRLLADDARPSQVVQLLGERERLRHELDELRGQSRRYAELLTERRKLELHVAEAEGVRDQLDHTHRLLQVATLVREKWHQRHEVLDQLSAMGEVPAVAARAVARYERADSRLSDRRTLLSAVRRQRQEVRREAAGIAVHERLWRQAPRIAALGEQRAWIHSLETDVARLRGEAATLETQLLADQRSLNLPTGTAHASRRPRSAGAFKPVARALAAAKQRRETARSESLRARETADRLQTELRTALAGRQQSDLNVALERAGTLVNQLRRRVQLDDRVDQLRRQQTQLIEQSNELVDRQVLPGWTLTAVGGVFAGGVALILVGLLLPGIGSVGWVLALLGILGGGGAVGAKQIIEGSNARQLEASQKQLSIADAQLEQSSAEREQLDTQLPRGGGPLLTRLGAAEKELSGLEELLPIDARRQTALVEAEATEALAEQTGEQYRKTRRRWQDALASAGLPAEWTSADVKRWFASHQQTDDLVRRIERTREELTQRERELTALTARVDQLVVDAGVTMAESGIVPRLDVLERQLAEQDARHERRAALDERARDLKQAERRHERTIKLWRGRRQGVLRAAGVSTVAELRRRAEDFTRAQQLRDRHAALSAEIAATLETIGTEEELRPHFERLKAGQLETFSRELTARRNEVYARLQSLGEQRGRLNEQMQVLVDDRRAADRAVELGSVEARLRETIHRWQVLAVTERLLTLVRRRFESERQPAVLREASHYLTQLTEGRYTRVWTPIDGHVLRVDQADGKALDVEVLSSGTREQLFLALRLAIAAAYNRRGAMMPMVLDDVLVNFDVERALAAAVVLRDFAATGVQVLVFTCHEHIAKLFKSLDVPVRRLPSSSQRAEVSVAKREPEPEPTPAIFIEPAAEKPEAERRSTRRRGRRRRLRRSEPFANTVWHEPVEDEVEVFDIDEDVDAA